MSTPLAALGKRTPEQLKVAELREELRKRGIQIKGLKKDLVDRLEDVLKQEELEQRKALAAVVDDAAAAPLPSDQSDSMIPSTKKRSKEHDYHAKEEAKVIVAREPDNGVVAPVRTEATSVVPTPQKRDIVFQTIAESLPAGSEAAAHSVAGGIDGTAATALEGEPMHTTVVLSVPAGDVLFARGPSPVDNANTTTAPPALEDLVADLERLEDPNFNKVLQEEPQLQQVEEESETTGVEILSGKSTDIVPTVDKSVDEAKGGTEEVINTTFVRTLSATVEEQVVSDQSVVTLQEAQVVTISPRVVTTEESANEVVTTEYKTTTFATLEKTTTIVADGDGVKLDAEAVKLLEDKGDLTMGDASEENANEDSVAETPKDQTVMDVDASTGKDSNFETPKVELPMAVDAGNKNVTNVAKEIESTPMKVDADTVKGSKRKDAGWFPLLLDSISLPQFYPFSSVF